MGSQFWKTPSFAAVLAAALAGFGSMYVHIQSMSDRLTKLESLQTEHQRIDAEEVRALDRRFEALSDSDKGSLVDRRDMQARLLRIETLVDRNSNRLDRLEGLQWKNKPDARFGPAKGAGLGG